MNWQVEVGIVTKFMGALKTSIASQRERIMGRRRKGLKEARRIVVKIGDLTTVFQLHREFLKSRPDDLAIAKQLRPAAVDHLRKLGQHLPDQAPKETPVQRFPGGPEIPAPDRIWEERNQDTASDLDFNIFEHGLNGSMDWGPQLGTTDWDPTFWSY
jgi:hypothetical protein